MVMRIYIRSFNDLEMQNQLLGHGKGTCWDLSVIALFQAPIIFQAKGRGKKELKKRREDSVLLLVNLILIKTTVHQHIDGWLNSLLHQFFLTYVFIH